MRVYCVGAFVYFPAGLLDQLDTIASQDNVELFVGLLEKDGSETSYSWTLEQRALLLGSLKSVTLVAPAPLILEEAFIKDQAIDAVYHMVPTNQNSKDCDKRFAVPMALGIYRTIRYESGIPTPNSGWDNVWETKGQKND